MEKVLLYFAIKYDGNWDKVYEALDKKEKIALEELQNIEDKITCQYLTILSSQYPAGLKTIYKPPFVIFYEGNIDLLKYSQKIIAITGSHYPNVYIKKVANDMVQQLVNHQKILMTSFNAGVEILVHQLIKENSISGNSVVIINDSNNYDANQQELLLYLKRYHLVISEYPLHMTRENISPIDSNVQRILLGLSKALLVLSFADEKIIHSLVDSAFNENKDVFAVPNQIYENFATNNLIKNSAKLVQTIDDIL
ncbi:DNA-processing protein DprA [Spiroplasma endosymbiont of Tipula paludosa]|uniref:DNA-processing protein DprA n=1 Tax=Spiroplasma endosymbiont of Tipula paludosa TaxID=3066295 RepID=UPI0035C8E172